MNIIKIDFNKDILLWFENPKSQEVINSLIEAIKADTKLPLFSVFEVEKNIYSLCPQTKIEVNWESFRDGGHHRAIAYYLSKWYVKAKLIPKPGLPVYMLQQWHTDIRKIDIVSNIEEYFKRKKRYWNYI